MAEVENGAFRVIKRLNRISALAKGMQSGSLKDSGLQSVQRILTEYLAFARSQSAQPIIIGTSALREAENSYILANWLQQEYNFLLHLISGEEEARFNGIANINEFEQKDILLFDIGGGSTEFTLIIDGRVQECQSLELGIRRLHNKFGDTAFQEIDYITRKLNSVNINKPPAAILTGIGGTVTSLAGMQQSMTIYDEKKIHKYQISQLMLNELITRIKHCPENVLPELIPYNPVTKALLLTGATIVREIIARFNASDFFVSDRTWQYGVLAEIITGRYII